MAGLSDDFAGAAPAGDQSGLVTSSLYTSKYRDEAVVIKCGGEVVDNPAAVDDMLMQAMELRHYGCNVIIVHGGGKQINQYLEDAGVTGPAERDEDGDRICSEAELEASFRALQAINQSLADRLNTLAAEYKSPVVPEYTSGYNRGLIRVDVKHEGKFTGKVNGNGVDLSYFGGLESKDNLVIPIIYPICMGPNRERLSVNADDVAAEVAMAVGAKRLIYCSTIPGVLDAQKKRIAQIRPDEVEPLIEAGVVTDGMKKKVRACRDVVQSGKVEGVVILDPRTPGNIRRELLTDEGSGTLFLPAGVTAGRKPAPAPEASPA